MGSTRLPGKVLSEIDGVPMLLRVVHRAKQAKRVNDVVVATTIAAIDDVLFEFCSKNGIRCFRGSENDVLDRFYQTAKSLEADAVVRITADCPLLDPGVVDRIVERYQKGDVDYASNVARCTYPDGLDTEVFSMAALQRAWKEAAKTSEREHVTPYIRYSETFKTANVEHACDVSNHRWTVDDPADLEFARAVYRHMKGKAFNFEDVLELLKQKPELRAAEGHAIMNEGYLKTLFAQAEAKAAPRRPVEASQALLARAQKVIPGTAQTFSKGRSQFVQGVSPIFLQRGKGYRVWDVDGNEYIDYIQGLLPNILGYANDEVNAAHAAQVAQGHSFSLPHPLEVELAERLTRLIPCAEMVRLGKNGSDATAGAVRAARAFTKRDHIACCGYHGWQDWFIGSTTRNAGVPEAVRALTHPFPYNDLAKLEQVLNEHPGQFAAVIMEPVNFTEPAPGYLQSVKELAQKHGALLIFDEICSGFHFGLGGAQKLFNVIPDLAAFGKAMGNGYPIACVVGRADVMKICEEIFFSFTFAGECASIAAAMKVLDILESTDALERMKSHGRTLQDGFNGLAKAAGLGDRLSCIGYPQWSLLKFKDAAGKDSMLERSLFQQESVKRGLLMLVTHNMTAAHDSASTAKTLEIYASVFKTLAGWLSEKDPSRFLEGPQIQPVFRVR